MVAVLWLVALASAILGVQQSTVHSAVQIMSSMGVRGPDELRPHMSCRRTDPVTVRTCAALYEWLHPGELLN
jgi:hypothetical protein